MKVEAPISTNEAVPLASASKVALPRTLNVFPELFVKYALGLMLKSCWISISPFVETRAFDLFIVTLLNISNPDVL